MKHLLHVLFFLSVSACGNPPQKSKIAGLTSGNPSSFTVSPDGGAVSLLFDNFVVGPVISGAGPAKPMVRNAAIATTGSNAAFKVEIRGFIDGDARQPKLEITSGESVWSLAPVADEGHFLACAGIAAVPGTTSLTLKASLGEASATDARLTVESVDIALVAASDPARLCGTTGTQKP